MISISFRVLLICFSLILTAEGCLAAVSIKGDTRDEKGLVINGLNIDQGDGWGNEGRMVTDFGLPLLCCIGL